MKTAMIMTDINDGYKETKRWYYTLPCFLENFDEVWIIDWNTPTGKPPLVHDLLKGGIPETGKIRNIVVTKEVHEYAKDKFKPKAVPLRLDGGEDMHVVTLPDSVARNIAIRRCDADWLAQSNVDMFGPYPEYFKTMLDGLDENTFYTVSRRDLDPDHLYNKWSTEEWREGLKILSDSTEERRLFQGCTPGDWFSIINCCGDFQIARRELFLAVRGYEEAMLYRNFMDTNIQKKMILTRKKVEALFSPAVFHIDHDQKGLHVQKCVNNHPMHWVENFSKTYNEDDWGLDEIDFDVEVY